MNNARRFPDPCPWIVAPLLLIWVAVSGLILAGRGDIESLLNFGFGPHVRPDAFKLLNGIAIPFWVSHSLLTGLAILAAWWRRTDLLSVLMIGPMMGILGCLIAENWSDPNWYDVVAVCSICWFVGSFVTGFYGLVNRRKSLDDEPR
ncbi:MAG: hypothetical protein ABS79_04815 [Planctomycetes bacterium SCN 63-9]|nr:MAG: hypothetical protein ABS79_04815 [Planctomycetes bacterium SCN 63-9]